MHNGNQMFSFPGFPGLPSFAHQIRGKGFCEKSSLPTSLIRGITSVHDQVRDGLFHLSLNPS
jgi:hypothetical protein